jgi:predicted Zn-dependent protease
VPELLQENAMKHDKTPSSALLCAVAAAAVLATSCASTMDYVTGERTRNYYTVQDDIRLGNQTFEEMKVQMAKDGTAVPSRDAAEVRRVKAIADRVFDATGQRETFAFDAELFDSKVVNAFAVPGGKIAVFTGLWNPKDGLVSGDDELAAVIAHEAAHVTCRHSTEEMTRQMPAQLLLAAAGLYAESQKDETWKSVVEGAFLVYNGLVVPKYSRSNEFEADRVSMQYMARAGFDPAASVRLWKRAYEKEGGEQGYMSILSTHPSNKARYEALQSQLPSVLAERDAPAAISSGSPPPPASAAALPESSKPTAQTVTTAKPAAAKSEPAKALVAPVPAKAPPIAPDPPAKAPAPIAPPKPLPLPVAPALPSVPAPPSS